MDNIEVWNKYNNKIPIIISIPHSGTYLPELMKQKLISNTVLANIDWYLVKLYSFLKDLEITTIINNVSRYVIDVNRKIIDTKDNSYTKNYIYTKTTFDDEMYKTVLDDKEIDARIRKYYSPYHKVINSLINTKLVEFDKIFLIDLHSFGKNIETDIVLGDGNGQTSSQKFTTLIKDNLENLGFKVILNKPYSGGYIIKKYASKNVETIQIELSYKKYIANRIFEKEEFPKIDEYLFSATQEKLRCFFIELIKQEIYKKY